MTEYISNLHDEHKTLLTLLRKCKKRGMDRAAAKTYIEAVKLLLADHLKLEDEDLYPKLRAMAKDNAEIAETVDEFSTGMEKIGVIINEFFNKFDNNAGELDLQGLSNVIRLLEVRIDREEKGLYTLYDYVVSK